MRVPVRLICDICLQSLEYSGDILESSETTCIHCGKTIQLSRVPSDDPTGEFNPRLDKSNSDTPEVYVNIMSKIALGQIGRFRLEKLLGDGGYGQVFLAYDGKLQRHVALKVLKPQKLDEKGVGRFLREARAAATLDHPHIVAVWDFGQDDERCWISYRLIRGKTLAERMRERRLSRSEAVKIAISLTNALAHAHYNKITHRDVKPSNIIIDERGEPHLTDFGLARRMNFHSEFTLDGAVLGSLNYMAPEQAAGRAAEADARSDIFSLGVVLFEMLAGRVPIDYTDSGHRLPRTPEPLPALRSIDPLQPKSLERICQKALHLHPERRYQTAEEMEAALKECLADSYESGPEPERPPRRRPTRGAIAAVVCSILLCGVFLSARGGGDAPAAPVEKGAVEAVVPIVEASRDQTAPNPVEPKAEFIGNSNSHVFHTAACHNGMKTLERNRQSFVSYEAAIEAGYKPCSLCHPGPTKADSATESEESR